MARVQLAAVFACLVTSAVFAADNADPLLEARQLYNQHHYKEAVASAGRAQSTTPGLSNRADLIVARAYLEQFRETGAPQDLANARERLRRIDPKQFDLMERNEFIIGLGEGLYFDGAYGAAAEVFETMLDAGDVLSGETRDRVLEWWAISVDRDAWMRLESYDSYQKIRVRMRTELMKRPGSPAAVYWLAAAARAEGDLQAAWDAAQAGWVRASLAIDRAGDLRDDLDRLMIVAIIPERAKLLSKSTESLTLEWETFKARWRN